MWISYAGDEYDVPNVGDICYYFNRFSLNVQKIKISKVSSRTEGSSLPIEWTGEDGKKKITRYVPPDAILDNPDMIDCYDCIYDKRYYFRSIENIVKSLFEVPFDQWDFK